MTHFHDPERAAAVRRALGRLLDLVARAVARELPGADGGPAAPGPNDPAPAPEAGVAGPDPSRPVGPAPRYRPGGLR